MREIKFRAWDNEDQKWIEAEPVYGFFPSMPYDKWKPDRYGDIQQYTGLKDKNGKEIYEGDVVEATHGNRFQISWMPKGAWNIAQATEYPKYEVIGNIYENPDLLK